MRKVPLTGWELLMPYIGGTELKPDSDVTALATTALVEKPSIAFVIVTV